MKLKSSLFTRRAFLNTLFGGWLAAFLGGSAYGLFKFAFPTLGREPDFVILDKEDFFSIPKNSVKPFAWGGKLGLFYKKESGEMAALKGVCTHMECNIIYRPDEKIFYCPCHNGWFDANGKNIAGPPPKPLEFFDYTVDGQRLIIARKGVKVDLPKS